MSTPTATIDTLQRSLEGRVIGPADDDYDAAREVFYGGIDKRPAAIARVANDDDIRRVIEIAGDPDVELAVRAGGHSITGKSSSNGGIVLDVRGLNALEIDAGARTAEAGAGLTAASTRRQLLRRDSRRASATRAPLGSAASRSAEGLASSFASTDSRSTTC